MQAHYALIIKHEVGGKSSYEKLYKHPSWPKGESGVTIGIGYDLGQCSKNDFTKDWKSHLSDKDFKSLLPAVGVSGQQAGSMISSLKSISIPYEIALKVFTQVSIPKYEARTKNAFPGCQHLHPKCFQVLLSLVFNRGTGMEGPTRIEMKNIRKIIAKEVSVDNIYHAIAQQIRSMKRIWENKGQDGLLIRRDEEANILMNLK